MDWTRILVAWMVRVEVVVSWDLMYVDLVVPYWLLMRVYESSLNWPMLKLELSRVMMVLREVVVAAVRTALLDSVIPKML